MKRKSLAQAGKGFFYILISVVGVEVAVDPLLF